MRMKKPPHLDPDLPGHLAATLHAEPPKPGKDITGKIQKACVLVPLAWRENEWVIYFIRRSQGLRHHRRQVAFPGGIMETRDGSPMECALREAQEEIGLPPIAVNPLGYLDGTPTVTGFWIVPLVGVIRMEWPVTPDPVEVEKVFTVSLASLMDPVHHVFDEREWRGHQYLVHVFERDGESIWGATGRIICQLLKRIGNVYELDMSWLEPPQGRRFWFPEDGFTRSDREGSGKETETDSG